MSGRRLLARADDLARAALERDEDPSLSAGAEVRLIPDPEPFHDHP